jgi:hypothetical protein
VPDKWFDQTWCQGRVRGVINVARAAQRGIALALVASVTSIEVVAVWKLTGMIFNVGSEAIKNLHSREFS